jgi:hypothetical protein
MGWEVMNLNVLVFCLLLALSLWLRWLTLDEATEGVSTQGCMSE